MVKLVDIREPDANQMRDVVFEANGDQRIIKVFDSKLAAIGFSNQQVIRYAEETNPAEIGASIPGTILAVLAKPGEEVKMNQPIAVIEAMKMETNIIAKADGIIDEIFVDPGDRVEANELIMTLTVE